MITRIVLFLIFFSLRCHFAGGECEEIMVPMCRGLVGYTHTKLPNKFNHTTQAEIYAALEKYWQIMDWGCSGNFRLLVCGTYLPKCTTNSSSGVDSLQEPCKSTCLRAKRKCRATVIDTNVGWPKYFKCSNYLTKEQGSCIRPLWRRKERIRTTTTYAFCQSAPLSMCQNHYIRQGSLPNYFRQSNRILIRREMRQYRPIFNCHPNFRFLLCGIFMPFCSENANTIEDMLVLPCKETCIEVRDQCTGNYSAAFGGLPWPAKLQCHRLPSGSDRRQCVNPGEHY